MSLTIYITFSIQETVMDALYCIISIHLYSASYSAHQSEALPVREDTERREQLKAMHAHYVHAAMRVY